MGIGRHPAVLAATVLTVAALTGCGAGTESATSAPSTSAPPGTSGTTQADPLAGETPLWPFSTLAEARRWQAQGEGHSPWHLDAEATAVFFATGYLGFTGVDKVIGSDIGATEATVTVGYQGDLPEPAPAAVIRLVRYGDGRQAPWEVIGTVDDNLTITEPEPGARIGSPVTVSGRITGVDESIHVQIHDPDRPEPVGDSCCLPAGGEDTPWTTRVPLRDASNATLTIVAATGGHAADVERFAVTGVQPAG